MAKKYKSYVHESNMVKKITPKELVWAMDQIQKEIVSNEDDYFYAEQYLLGLPETKKLWGNDIFLDDLKNLVMNMKSWRGRNAILAKNIVKQFVMQSKEGLL